MVHARPQLPEGHGEVLTRPDVAQWPALLDSNRDLVSTWRFEVAGMPGIALRESARAEALAAAAAFSERLGVPVAPPGPPSARIIATGHQPEIYHPGVWVKDFLVDSVGRECGATALDVVVDTDGFDAVEIVAPCLTPEVRKCRQYLAVGTPDAWYAKTPVPSAAEIETFCSASADMIASLPAPAVGRHFGEFCKALSSAEHDASNLAELVTFARRRYEAPAATSYLELPATSMVAGSAFARFVAHLVLDARAFAEAYNAELDAYRVATRTRSAAQPFPDLATGDQGVELPLWHLGERRRSLFVRERTGAVELVAGDERIAVVPHDPEGATEAIAALGGRIAPKAVPLTMFVRMFVCDLFVHGVGGARYDRVTDAVIERYLGVTPPGFAIASMTMYLPLGAHVVTDEEVASATELVNRFEHNPDQLLDQVDFDDAAERRRAVELAQQKADVLVAMKAPGADKKALGMRVRELNAELRSLLAPFGESLVEHRDRLSAQQQTSEVFTDRGYPFAFWSPLEVADKVR